MPNVLSNKNTLANRNALNRAKLAREMTHDFSASGVPNEGQRFRDLVNDARGFVADMSPGYGDVLASQRASQAYGQAWDALKGGDLGQALGRGAEGLTEHLSIIPGIGDIATMGKAATGMLPGLVGMTRGSPDLASRAKEFFGVTYSPRETGYLLPDGTRLDLSGRHYATGYEKTERGYKPKLGEPDYLRGNRVVDHREVGKLVEEGGTEGMFKLMSETGAVRVMPGTGVSVVGMPTDAQLNKIVSDFRSGLYLDVDDPTTFATLASKEFDKPTVNSLKRFLTKILKINDTPVK